MKNLFAVLISTAFVFATAQATDQTHDAHTTKEAAATAPAGAKDTKSKEKRKKSTTETGSSSVGTQEKVAPAGERDGSGNQPNHPAPKTGTSGH